MSILQDLLNLNVEPPVALAISEAEEPSAYEAEGYAEELEGYHKKMVQIMDDVRHIVRQLPRSLRGQAEAYWIPHIMIALGGEHEWMTAGHESTLEKTIEGLKEYAQEDGGDERIEGDEK